MEFAARVDEMEREDADLERVGLVTALFGDAGADLDIVARFVQGRVVPAHDGTKLDVGPSLCYEALAKAAGPNVSAADVEERLAAVGEIGTVAEELDLGGQQGLVAFGAGDDEGLTVAEADAQLGELAAAEGAGSTDRKLDALFGLFTRTEPLEARFLARLVLGEMRVGVGEGAVRDAIAEAFEVPVAAVERAIQVSNDCGLVAETARDGGEEGLAAVRLEVGRPVKAMLAQAGTAVDALEEWGSAAVETDVEYKTDEYGIDVDDVAPAYTSQRCGHDECGFTHEDNRDGDEFECLKCGKQLHSDYNAARNVGWRPVRHWLKSGAERATSQLALKSGTLNANGRFQPTALRG